MSATVYLHEIDDIDIGEPISLGTYNSEYRIITIKGKSSYKFYIFSKKNEKLNITKDS